MYKFLIALQRTLNYLLLLFIGTIYSFTIILSSCDCDTYEAIDKGVMKVFHHNFLNKMRSLFAFNANAKETTRRHRQPTHKGRS